MTQNNKFPPPKVAAIHDLSGLGRCSLTVIIPVLSAMGLQVCPLPTALLSTHTGGYENFTFLDLTNEMTKIASHWKDLGTHFDALYTGFLGSDKQIDNVLDFVSYFKKKCGSFYLADPVMGDDGIIYKTYTEKMCKQSAMLIKYADVITPNLTEACILLNTDYKECFNDKELRDMLTALSDMGAEKVVITGILSHDEKPKMGVVYLDRAEKNPFGNFSLDMIEKSYPGTGDVFASVLLGKLMNKKSLSEAVLSAVSFVHEAIKYTCSLGTPVREGVAVESLWSKLK